MKFENPYSLGDNECLRKRADNIGKLLKAIDWLGCGRFSGNEIKMDAVGQTRLVIRSV